MSSQTVFDFSKIHYKKKIGVDFFRIISEKFKPLISRYRFR